MATDYSQKANKIDDRDWLVIRISWIDHVPDFSEPGSPPESLLAELPALDEKVASIPKTQTKIIEDNLPGLRQGVLHEGIYLFHKAAHTFGASLVHVERGMCTWSLSSAYHSAYFAMKAILCLLGVAIVESQRGNFLIDVWHTPDKHRRRKKPPVVFIYNSGKIEHGQLWACFQRALKKTINCESICGQLFLSHLTDLDPEQFARQRNDLHYQTNAWSCRDLHACLVQENFGKVTQTGLDFGQPDFLLALACGLIHMGHRMIGQLGESSKPILGEKALIDAWLNQPFNRLYRENSDIIASTLNAG